MVLRNALEEVRAHAQAPVIPVAEVHEISVEEVDMDSAFTPLEEETLQ